ncbi:MAG: hypothetical protein GXO10_01310 [Crenarchaeota archaeon]|nr:hypothetical protein [Thermoproteota archaeon]
MGFDISSIFSGGISGILGEINKLVDQFHLSPEEKQKLQLEAQQIIQSRFNQLQQTLRAVIEARADIIKAELASGDNYTRRARPTIAYAGIAYIGINKVLFPILARILSLFISDPSKIKLLTSPLPALPAAFWTAWAGVVGSWVIGRTFEKAKIGINLGNEKVNKVAKTILGME